MTERESSAEIATAAADWAVRVDCAEFGAADQAELDDWLARDSRRLGAFARASAVLVHARRARALGADFDPDRYRELQPERGAAAMPSLALPQRSHSRRGILIGGSVAAAATALAAVGFSLQAAAHTYTTARGEIRHISLDDGSSMTLNTASTARVAFSRHERLIDLVEGEAMFEIVPDAGRPFLVAAGKTQIRASDTSFAVRRLVDEVVEVVVRQGSVEIGTLGGGQPSRIAANGRVIADRQAPLRAITLLPEEVARELSWREGMLSFEDMPLKEAAREFARYSDRPIRFADPALAEETITGLYAANNPAGFARSAALSLGIQAEIRSDAILLRRNK